MKRLLLTLAVSLATLVPFSLMAHDESASRQEEILSFWFGKLDNSYEWNLEKAELWFNGNKELDQAICEAFGHDLHLASSGEYDEWEKSPRGMLALIILLDQFPRNIFRGTPEAFHFHHLAEKLAFKGIEVGFDRELFPIERQFFYLPLMHSESLEHQELSLEIFRELAEEVDKRNRNYFLHVESYAENHFEIVKRFGRFPHRNAILDRANTEEEIEYLNLLTTSYGQSPAS